MLVKWTDLVVVRKAPVAIQISERDAWIIESDPGEEFEFISTMEKIARHGEDAGGDREGWLRVPLDEFSEKERKILRNLLEYGLIELEEGENL